MNDFHKIKFETICHEQLSKTTLKLSVVFASRIELVVRRKRNREESRLNFKIVCENRCLIEM